MIELVSVLFEIFLQHIIKRSDRPVNRGEHCAFYYPPVPKMKEQSLDLIIASAAIYYHDLLV